MFGFATNGVVRGQASVPDDGYIRTFESLKVREQRKALLKNKIKTFMPDYDADKYTKMQHMPRMESQLDLGAAALIAGLTNVVSYRLDTLGSMYQDLGIGGMGLHAIGHGGTSNGFTSPQMRKKIDAYHLTLIHNMARKFEAIKEGDGTMLDNTMIVYLSCSGGKHHGDGGNGGGIYSTGTLTLDGAVLQNNQTGRGGNGGHITDGGFGGNGGGIYSRGATLSLDHSLIQNNQTGEGGDGDLSDGRGGGGGGIFSNGNTLTLDNSVVQNNKSGDGLGGGIYSVVDSAQISTSSIHNNDSTSNGGGIYIQSATVFTVDSSTFSNNNARFGGGISAASSDATINNSTFSGNVAEAAGGILTDNSNFIILDSTITDNEATDWGGGVANSFTSSISIGNTILAGNTAVTDPDGASRLNATVTSLGHNIIGDDSGFGFTAIASDQVGTTASPIDPMLGPLGDNGGPTLTHSLIPGSPAIDMGRPALVSPSALTLDAGTEFYPATQLIGNSGFAVAPTFDFYAAAQHTVNAATAWVSDAPGGFPADYFAVVGAPTPVFTIDLGTASPLTDLVVWGYSPGNDNEAKEFQLEFSVDAGAFTAGPTLTRVTQTGAGQETLSLGGTFLADTIRVTVTDNFFEGDGSQGGDRVGFGEIKFLSRPTDQRGVTRPLDGDGVNGTETDIGAVERGASAPTVTLFEINTVETDPVDLPKGPQPTSWQEQRSDIRSLRLTFSEPMDVDAGDLVLTNLGLNAPADDDQVISITDDQLTLVNSVLTIAFDADELPEGVFQLEVLSTATDLAGNPLDGDDDGFAGGSFSEAGNAVNHFYKLIAEWSGDEGVSVFDFTTFSYWFGSGAPTAPEYADLNGDLGVSVFDFTHFASNFGKGVTFETGFAETVATPLAVAPVENFATPNLLQRQNLQRTAANARQVVAESEIQLWQPMIMIDANRDELQLRTNRIRTEVVDEIIAENQDWLSIDLT